MTTMHRIISSIALLAALVAGAVVLPPVQPAEAFLDCIGCKQNEAPGGNWGGFWPGDFSGGYGGGGEGGGGGGGGGGNPPSTPPPPTPTPPAPVCTLNLTATTLSWTSTNATVVTIHPLTNSPDNVPGASTSTTSTGGSAAATLFYDSFEHLPGYTNPAWNSVGQNWLISENRHHSGTRGARVEGPSTGSITKVISTVGHGSVTFSYWFRAANLEASAGEYVKAEWTADGSTWTTLSTVDDSNDVGDWIFRSHMLPASAANNPNFAIRFRANLHNANDDVFIDDVTVANPGTAGSVGGIPPMNGTHTFNPALGVGTHTYRVTATGPGGSVNCDDTVIIPPPPTDMCPNITGNQTTVPDGMHINGNGDCVPTPPQSVTIHASKIVCSSEADLPNWSGTSQNITASTATNFLASHPNCHLEDGWSFQYADANSTNPGDGAGVAGTPWTTFTDTNNDGVATATFLLSSLANAAEIHLREVIQSGYIPFTGVGGSAVSAEMYCDTDVLNYDNFDFIRNPSAGNTYYCVAFNVPTAPVDVCPNLSGNQATIPDGYRMEGGQCVPITNPSGPVCTLTASASSVVTGNPVRLTWTSSNATTGSFDNYGGGANPVSGGTTVDLFPPSTTTYTGTFGNGTATTTCAVTVAVTSVGCTNCGGGGLNQPTVTLASAPGGQVLSAFVSLAQVPYTGFEAGSMLAFLFWLAVGLWSAGIAYVLMGRTGMRLIAERLFAYAPVAVEYDEGVYAENAPLDAHGAPERTVSPVMTSTMAMPMPMVSVTPMPAASIPVREEVVAPAVAYPTESEGLPELADVIESRAHAAGILLSPEALSMALGLSEDRAETLTRFGEILNEAVRTIPREDGWILLSSDRFAAIRPNVSAPAAVVSVAPAVQEAVSDVTPATMKAGTQIIIDSAAEQLAAAIIEKNRDAAFSLIRTAEKEGTDPRPLMTGVAKALDRLYHARRDGTATPFGLGAAAETVASETLEQLVAIFTDATGTAYTSPYTGVKLALAQALEVR